MQIKKVYYEHHKYKNNIPSTPIYYTRVFKDLLQLQNAVHYQGTQLGVFSIIILIDYMAMKCLEVRMRPKSKLPLWLC